MRDYGKVSPQFWIGRTGKALRGNAEAQVLALYLMTSPHANMIGVYHCPVAYMAHETGLTTEGASKALQSLIEADFCTFDAVDEYVFVHQFALHQVGESLLPNDKRCKGVENELAKVPKNQCWQAFRARYAVPYNLPVTPQNASPSEAPSESLGSQKQKQKQEQEQKQEEKKTPRKRSAATPDIPCPPDVAEQVWTDWLTHRKKKSAPVTETVVEGAREQAQLACMTLEDFLRVWCRRGSQGLEAEWLKPHERTQPAETTYQRSMRERMQEAAPEAARRDPSHAAHAVDFFNAIEVPTRTVERIK